MLILRRVGNYSVKARLGGGRYGICYLAEDQKGNPVVLKRFRRRMRKKNKEKNHHEAVILSNLCHPAIPQLLGVINHAKGYFFVLEYKRGDSLEKLLFRQRKRFSGADVFRIGSQLLDVMAYLHQRGIVHRDISISNVLDTGYHVSLVDFGLARYANADTFPFSLDYSCFGNLLLYLLYSSYCGKGNSGAWHQELPLSEEKRQYLMRLMGLAEPFPNTEEVCRQFSVFFPPQK